MYNGVLAPDGKTNFKYMSWTEWWIYAAVTLTAFIGCLILNFIVKVINDARLEDRCLRIRQKALTNQGTQMHCSLAEITARAPIRVIPLDNMLEKQITQNRISLVFNREHNIKDNKRLEDIDLDGEISSVNVICNPTSGTRSSESIAKPILLGNIYNKNIPDITDIKQIPVTKNEDSASVVKDIECKSAINVRTQNYQDLNEWLLGLVTKITNDVEK